MINVIMHGCNGMMGQMINELMKEDTQAKIVAGIDLNDTQNDNYPVYKTLMECSVKADVIISFASVKGLDELLDYCVNNKVPVVLCTTGLSEKQLNQVEECSRKVALLKSANMSLGINTLINLIQRAASVFSPAGFDMEIVEKHHNKKVDAPSGTALALADALNDALNHEYHYVYDRSQDMKRREKKEIGISAVRGGSIVGEHEVIFAGPDEVIEFKHTAYSKAVFGKGAIQAAKYLAGKPAGYYNMSHVVEGE